MKKEKIKNKVDDSKPRRKGFNFFNDTIAVILGIVYFATRGQIEWQYQAVTDVLWVIVLLSIIVRRITRKK